jgi:AraC-like DNA-binding protein
MTTFSKRDFFAYLTGGAADEWGVELSTVGYHHIAPHSKYPPLGHPKSHAFNWRNGRTLLDCHILYVPTGAGFFQTRGGTTRIGAGSLIFIYPDDWHRYRPAYERGWEEYWVGFKGSYIDKYIVRKLFPHRESYVRTIGHRAELIALLHQLMEMCKTDTPLFKTASLGCLLQIVAYCIAPLEPTGVRPRHAPLLDGVIAHIRENLFGHVNFHDLARSVGLSYSRFRSVFKEGVGIAPQQFLINERLECAKRLLRSADMDIKTIAYKAGFQSPSYFSRAFRLKTGFTPSGERERRR